MRSVAVPRAGPDGASLGYTGCTFDIRDARGAAEVLRESEGRQGVPRATRRRAQVAMQMTGHKIRSVFERYNIVNVGDLREAARRLDIATGTISGTIEEDRRSGSKV